MAQQTTEVLLPEHVLIVSRTDTGGRITFVNDALAFRRVSRSTYVGIRSICGNLV
jgi:hypothetical protein